MSNDTRFWMYRIASIAVIAFDLWVMKKMTDEAFNAGAHTGFWALAFFVSIILSIPVGFLAYKAQNSRWEKAKPMDRIEVETLSDYPRQTHKRQGRN